MTIQDLKNLDLYKCSLQDINKAFKVLRCYLANLRSMGESTSNNFRGSERYNEAKELHVLISRARNGMTENGVMLNYNGRINRLPNSQSVL